MPSSMKSNYQPVSLPTTTNMAPAVYADSLRPCSSACSVCVCVCVCEDAENTKCWLLDVHCTAVHDINLTSSDVKRSWSTRHGEAVSAVVAGGGSIIGWKKACLSCACSAAKQSRQLSSSVHYEHQPSSRDHQRGNTHHHATTTTIINSSSVIISSTTIYTYRPVLSMDNCLIR